MNTKPINDGGPAFAEVVQVELEGQGGRRGYRRVGGMSIRQYFAASAPDVPDWYVGNPMPLPTQDISWKFCEGCKSEGDCRHDADCEKIFAYRTETDRIKTANKALRLFQWRWYYADGMIAAMKPTPSAPPEFTGTKIYISWAGDRDVGIPDGQAEVRYSFDAMDGLDAKGRNEFRKALETLFSEYGDGRAAVLFADECPDCGEILEDGQGHHKNCPTLAP